MFNTEAKRGEREMPGGMGKMELCYLASLLLCDKIF